MSKWYAICAVLAVLLLISLGMYSTNSSELGRVKGELAQVRAQLNELQNNYDNLLSEYNLLRTEPGSPVGETETPSLTPPSKPSRPPLHIGETMRSHDFAFTPIEVGYTEVLIKGPFKGNTFDAFTPIEGYKFFYLKMIVQNQGTERASPPMYGGDAEFKVKVDKGYIYQEINQIASLSWADEKRWIGQADPSQMQEYPCSNYLIFDLNPEDEEQLLVAFEILKDTEPIEITFRLFACPEFAAEYGIETIVIPIGE